MTDLNLASDRVGDVLAAFELHAETETRARELAGRADWDWPINRSADAIAAAAVYVAALEYNDKITQEPLAAAADCSEVALRDTYHELFEQLGYGDPTERHARSKDAERERGWAILERIKERMSGAKGATDD